MTANTQKIKLIIHHTPNPPNILNFTINIICIYMTYVLVSTTYKYKPLFNR